MAKPPFPWVGNKEKLIPYIRQIMPPRLTQLTEAFGGSGALLLDLAPCRGRLDIYNDLSDDLFNVFCCIKERVSALCKELKFFPLHGRTAFHLYRDILSHEPEYRRHIRSEKELIRQETSFSERDRQELLSILDGRAALFDVQRAAAFLLVQYGSFSGTGNSVGVKTIDVGTIIDRLADAAKRLETIFLEHQNAMELIQKRDQPGGLIYADPPYVDAERCYDVSFSREDHIRLRDVLTVCRGYVILSYNDCPRVWELYRGRFYISGLKRENPLSQAKAATYGELILTNYDPRPFMDRQMDLFSSADMQKWELKLLHAPDQTQSQ